MLLNWIGGAELANDNHTKRNVFDVVAILKPTTTLTLGFNGDYGKEDGTSRVNPGQMRSGRARRLRDARADEQFSLALRGETFRDEGGTRLGTDTQATLSEATLTPLYKFTDHVVFRGEVRYDKANQPILARRGTVSDKQTTVGANVIFVY